MIKSPRKFGFKATAIALVAATSMTLAGPAFAGGRHGGGWGWGGQPHHGGYYGGGHHGHDDGLAAVAVVGGVLLGAALLSQASQPAYAPPPQTYYAPPPAGYYGQAPIQATPASDVYQTQSGQYCREYQSSVRVGGQMQYGYGTACQQPDGQWRVVN
ncbi:MAG TPA: hypothetical protein VGN05_15175 [Parvibaculum sp.]|jgi:hypothetical protein